jgi:hypothetical protein
MCSKQTQSHKGDKVGFCKDTKEISLIYQNGGNAFGTLSLMYRTKKRLRNLSELFKDGLSS